MLFFKGKVLEAINKKRETETEEEWKKMEANTVIEYKLTSNLDME